MVLEEQKFQTLIDVQKLQKIFLLFLNFQVHEI